MKAPGAVIIGKGYSDYGIEPLGFDTGRGNGGTSYSFTAQTTRAWVLTWRPGK